MELREKAYAYLNQDVAQNIHMIQALKYRDPVIIAVTDRGVLLDYDRWLSLSCDDVEAAKELLQFAPQGFTDIVVCREEVENYVAEAYGLKKHTVCVQTSYQKQEKLPIPEGLDIRQLDMSFHDIVLEKYSLFHDPDYITDRINAGVMYGVFVEGKLAGFIGEHDEGSMGMLEIFPEYRRMGLGYALEAFQINRIVAEGRVPFDHVIIDNVKSFHLQEKLGMTFSRDHVTFMGE